jgi:hypothetical protein
MQDVDSDLNHFVRNHNLTSTGLSVGTLARIAPRSGIKSAERGAEWERFLREWRLGLSNRNLPRRQVPAISRVWSAAAEAGYLVGIGKGAILIPRLDGTRPFLPVNIALLIAPARPTTALGPAT